MKLGNLLKIWSSFARAIGTANTYLLLSLLYILIVTPIGLMMRIFGKDILSHPASGTRWVRRAGEENFERQY